ncbi:MAG: V-type ATP synthase subunit F [Bacillota bacterium]
MKSFLISDNRDTLVGMKLAGIDGVIAHGRSEVLQALKSAMKNNSVGIIIFTEKAADQVREEIMEIKLKRARPLLVEIPDRHGGTKSQDMIAKYIRDSVGIRI